MKSISQRLIVLLLGALIVAAVLSGISSYLEVREEIDELFDYQLRQTAISLRNQKRFEPLTPESLRYEQDEGFTVQVWDPAGALMYVSHHDAAIPRARVPGLQTLTLHDGEWRVFLLSHQGRTIQVSQALSVRQEMGLSFALRAIVPLLVIFTALALIIWLVVRYTLRPLNRVANGVARLSPSSLESLPENDLPMEVLPLVQKLNSLLYKLGHAFDIQKRFVADAAHELRTPLTAVKLQARILERSSGEEERGEALANLKSGIDRASRLVAQLLSLARVEPEAQHVPMVEVSLNLLVREIIMEQFQIASDRGILLGATNNLPVSVSGEPDTLRTMISNLVDNALRYTLPGGTVDLNLRENGEFVIIEVADTGPGIPREERERIFDRFYRGHRMDGAGCGLGMSIVKSAVMRHGGTITLDETTEGKGLKVIIALPRQQLITT